MAWVGEKLQNPRVHLAASYGALVLLSLILPFALQTILAVVSIVVILSGFL